MMLAIPIRKIYNLEDFITDRHLQNSAKVMLATGLIVAYGYGMEAFMGWYSGKQIRLLPSVESSARALRVLVLGIADLQHRHSAGTGFPEDAYQPLWLCAHLFRRPGRHVARAFHHRRGQLAARFPYVLLGDVLPNQVGLDDLHRDDGHVPGCHFPVCAHPADDFDF